jgi:hypothetical protein
MLDMIVILIHSIVTVIRLMKPGGLRAVVAESAVTRHQILILNRSRKRAPNLRASDRLIAGLCTLLMHPSRLRRCGMVLKPSTLLHFHQVLTNRKYHLLFSSKRGARPRNVRKPDLLETSGLTARADAGRNTTLCR